MAVPAAPPAVEPFGAVDVIVTKRDGATLTDAQIDWVVEAYTHGAVAEEQVGALAMTIYLHGMSRAEIARWTEAMIASGERMDFSGLPHPTADKHSTGGMGDKVTLPPASLMTAFGVNIPQLSGRGLGHTGGTLDKLESIPDWRVKLTGEEILVVLGADGPDAVICVADAGLAPVDKRLYALRDTTTTASYIPLIASSIMSKKITEDAGTLVLGVKVGSGAFMRELGQTRELASTMVTPGTNAGVTTRALLTGISAPLRRTANNAPEVAESLEVLAGGGPTGVVDLTVTLALEMCTATGRPVEEDAARTALADGRAMDIWRNIISCQGGDPDAPLPLAPETETVTAPTDGVLTALDALAVGMAAWRLGVGRTCEEDSAQAVTGVTMHAKPGNEMRAGQPLLALCTAAPKRFTRAREAFTGGIVIFEAGSPEAADAVTRHQRDVILERIG